MKNRAARSLSAGGFYWEFLAKEAVAPPPLHDPGVVAKPLAGATSGPGDVATIKPAGPSQTAAAIAATAGRPLPVLEKIQRGDPAPMPAGEQAFKSPVSTPGSAKPVDAASGAGATGATGTPKTPSARNPILPAGYGAANALTGAIGENRAPEPAATSASGAGYTAPTGVTPLGTDPSDSPAQHQNQPQDFWSGMLQNPYMRYGLPVGGGLLLLYLLSRLFGKSGATQSYRRRV